MNLWYIGGAATNVAGAAMTYFEYDSMYNGKWRGRNNKWYSLNWGGNQWTGPRSKVITIAKHLRGAGFGLFLFGTGMSGIEGYEAVMTGNYIGAGQAGMDIVWGAAATFGGWAGFVGGTVYYGTSQLIRVPAVHGRVVTPIVDAACSISDC